MPSFWDQLLQKEQEAPLVNTGPEAEAALIAKLLQMGPPKKEQQPAPPIIVPAPDGTMRKMEAQGGKIVSKQVNAPYSPDQEFKDLRDKLAAKTEESLNLQSSGISQMEQNLKDLKNKPFGPEDVNLAPMLAFYDSWLGTDVLKGYRQPETREAKRNKILEIESGIQKAREGLTDKEIENLRAQLNTSMMNKAMAQNARNDRFNESQLYKKEKDIGTDLEKDIYDPLSEKSQQLDILNENLASGDSQKITGTLGIFARLISGEKGVLTDKDVVRVLPRNFAGDVASFVKYFEDNPSARMDPAYTEKMREMIATARNAMLLAYEDKIDQKHRDYKARRSFGDVFGPGGSGDTLFDNAKATLRKHSSGGERIKIGDGTVPAPNQGGGGGPTGFMSPDDFFKNKGKK